MHFPLKSDKILSNRELMGMIRKERETFKVAIIGGGASGLMLATLLSQKIGGQNVALIEKNQRVGKKLLSTGNGQCNFANKNLNTANFYGENPQFSAYAIEKFGVSSLLEFYSGLGILPLLDGDKYYPYSKQASSVLDALRFKIESLKTRVFLDLKVESVVKKDGVFELSLSNGESVYSTNVVLAVGGKSSSYLGSDGSSYKLYQNFGHTVTGLYPSLVQLKCDAKRIRGLKGLKQKVKVTANGIAKKVAVGDVMFTDYGLSGNSIFSISPCFAGRNGEIEIDFCPTIEKERLIEFLNDKVKNCPYLTCEYLFLGIINAKISSALLRNQGFDLTEKITSVDILKAVQCVKNYKVEILGTMGFDNSQVTRGGLRTFEFDDKTMQSKLANGLYAIGEVLDIDGDCGGYNLQWAYSSASVACESIVKD